ncbi:unnamed protein product [Cochlearia groenlandica]
MEKTPYVSSSQPNKMISPSSRKLNDQDYMELVCENGQMIFAKNQRVSFENQRKQSIIVLDLYEKEYNDSLKKNIINSSLGDTKVVPLNNNNNNSNNNNKNLQSSKGFKSSITTIINDGSLENVEEGVITTPPDEQSAAAVGISTELYFASSRGTPRDLLSCNSSFKRSNCGDLEDEESSYLYNYISDDESDDAKTRVLARTRKTLMTKRKRSTQVHKLYERKRRNEMNKRMRTLQDLLPNCHKDNKVSLLDAAIKYMRTLQLQVQMMMSMRMGNGLIRPPPTMLPIGHYHYSPMGLAMHHMGNTTTASSIPQFMPMNAQATGFSGFTNIPPPSSQMPNFLNDPTGLIQNSPMFSTFESCSNPFVVPSCLPQPQTTSFTQYPKSTLLTSNFEVAMQFVRSNCYFKDL